MLSVYCPSEASCYTNRIQQCTIEAMVGLPTLEGSPPLYIQFNNCHLQSHSTKAAVDQCAKALKIPDVFLQDIKRCGADDSLVGKYLMIEYGWIRKRDTAGYNVQYNPFLLINNKETRSDDLVKAVCKILKNPPPVCSEYS